LPAGEKAQLSLQLPAEFLIVFEPVTHAAQFIDVKGEPTRERQNLSLVFNNLRAPTGTVAMRPGPLRLSLENRTETRVLPAIWIAGDALHELLGRRRPFLTAKRLLTNQTFRDIYRTDTIDPHQRLKITSLTFLFTDLKGSTELYQRVGDLAAFDLVRAHFGVLNEIVAGEAGAVVKTIGDAVMATFPTPDRAMAAALIKLGYLDQAQEPAPMVRIIYMLFEPVITDRVYHPDEFDAIGKAATVSELAFEHKLYKSPRHSIFLLRALIGLDGIMKGLGVKMNYAALFRECVKHAAKAKSAN